MPFDTVTLIICAVVIVTAIVTPMMNIFFRKVRTGEGAILRGGEVASPFGTSYRS